jgi:hypothetical protein
VENKKPYRPFARCKHFLEMVVVTGGLCALFSVNPNAWT